MTLPWTQSEIESKMNRYSHLVNERSPMPLRSRDTMDTKGRIERAALELFVSQGIAGTSIREIASAAGASLGAMYNHYTSKEDLAWTLFIDGWSGIAHELRLRAKEHDTLEARFRSMIRYVFRRFDEDWLLVTYVFTSRHHHLKRVPPARDNPYMIFRLVIADAIRKGEVPRMNAELATSLIVGAIIQATDSRILNRLKGSLEQYADETATACINMLRGR